MTVLEATCGGREEELAAFIDGRLPDGERRELIAHLADCEVCSEIFRETSFLLEADAEPAPGSVAEPAPPAGGKVLRPGAWWRRPAVIAAPLAAAAMLALVLAPGIFDSGRSVLPAGELLPAIASPARIEDAWRGAPWAVPRGPAAGVVHFKLGVRTVDLDVALRAGKAADAKAFTAELAHLLGSDAILVALVVDQKALYATVEDRLEAGEDPAGLLALARSAEAGLDETFDFDPDYLLGKWARAAFLAAAAGDATFFEGRSQRRMLRGIVRDFGEAAPRGLAEVARLAESEPAGEALEELRGSLERLIHRRGSQRDVF